MKLEERMIEESRTNSFRADLFSELPTSSSMLGIDHAMMSYFQLSSNAMQFTFWDRWRIGERVLLLYCTSQVLDLLNHTNYGPGLYSTHKL